MILRGDGIRHRARKVGNVSVSTNGRTHVVWREVLEELTPVSFGHTVLIWQPDPRSTALKQENAQDDYILDLLQQEYH